MRNLIFYFFLICTTAFSQNYELVDKVVSDYPSYSNLETLSERIKKDFKTEAGKARAAYTWIANNIRYDLETYGKPKVLTTITYTSEYIFQKEKKKFLKRKVKLALLTKKALCEGYSAMFNELCNLLNLESKIIKGIAKVNPSQINSFKTRKNHAWNAVKVNGKWQLLDITWSSGFVDSNTGKWIKNFNDFYYFANPKYFITTHYPQHEKWQLLDNSISLQAFYEKPIFYKHYFNSNIILEEQQNGHLIVSDKRIVFNFNRKNTKDNLYYSLLGDKYIRPLRVRKNDDDTYRAFINYKNNSSDILMVYINKNPALSFKIN